MRTLSLPFSAIGKRDNNLPTPLSPMPMHSLPANGQHRSLQCRIIISVLFFLSGFCALLYEVVWSRMLVLVMGNTVFATTTILTTFMAGLSLGGFYWGRHVDATTKNPLRLFGLLEIGIGIAALLVSKIIWTIIPAGTWMSQVAGLGNPFQTAVRFLLCLALLLPPTFLIGGTLAAIGKYIISDRHSFAQRFTGLYGVNTIGSFFGACVTGFFLIKSLGHNGSLLVAVVLNCIGGGFAVWMSRVFEEAAALPAKTPARKKQKVVNKADERQKRQGLLIMIGLFVSGFCAVAYQILWTRLLILAIDNSVYSFTIILMACLAGIALGSILLNRFIRFLSAPLLVFAFVEIGIGVSAFCFPFAIHLKPNIAPNTQYSHFLFSALPLSILVPTVLMGIAFPLGAYIYHLHEESVGKSIGFVYSVNTAGCVCGGLLTGFFLIGALGFQKSTFILAGLNLATGALIGLFHRNTLSRVVIAVLLIALPFLGFRVMPADYFERKYAALEPESKLIYYNESPATTATIFERPNLGRILYLNGIPEVDTSHLSVKTFKLMGALPGLLHRNPDNALMITFGAGISAGTTVLFAKHLDCVDLASQAPDIAPFFEYYNNKIKDNPSISLYNDDARHFLQSSNRRYSLITSDASHPRVYDSWILFTTEFYRLVQQRLTADGIFLQWLPFHGLSPEQYFGIVNTFAHVFRHISIWSVGEGYSLLVATPQPLQIDFQDFLTKSMTPPIKRDLHLVGLDNTFELLSYFCMAEDGVRKMLAETPQLLMTDNSPAHLFFPIFSTFKDQYTTWPLLNYQKLREHKESVIPYLVNLSDDPTKKEQLLNVLQYYEHRNRQ